MMTLFYRQRRYLALAIVIIVAIGSSSLLTIGRQEDPTITNLFATVLTPFPGATPSRVEALVTEKIEDKLREIAEIQDVTSVSRTGISAVTIELSAFITDAEIEIAWSEIRDALSEAAVDFPPGVPEPTFDNDRTSAYTLISALVPKDGREVPLPILSRYGEALQDLMRQSAGTQFVRLYGEVTEEVTITVDPYKLASAGLTPATIAASLAQADAKVRAGRVRGAVQDYLVEVDGSFETLERIRDIPIVSGNTQATLRLGDVAQIEKSYQTPVEALAFANGSRALVVASRMEPGLQVDTWTDALRIKLADFEGSLPQGIEHRIIFDQSDYTNERLETLLGNLLIGVGLVVIVLFITLGWRAAFVVSLMLPFTAMLSIAVLQAIGVPIHQMSVTGLIVALGLLVDAAIVMADEIRQGLSKGIARLGAVGNAVRRLAVPLLASTITTVLAFTPMALLPGPAGDFVGSIAISVIIMLTVSLILALTITPALAGLILKQPDGRPARGLLQWVEYGVSGGIVARAFIWSLDLSLRHKFLSILAALALPLIGFGAFPSLTAQFFPGVERNQFYIQVTLADGSSIAATKEAVRRADEIIAREDGITDLHWFVGESAPAFYYNMQANRDGVPHFAEALVTTETPMATREIVPRLQKALDQKIPEAQILVRGLVQGPPVDAPLEMRIVGPGIETLRQIGDEARLRMVEIDAVTHTRANLVGGAPKMVFDLDEDMVAAAGLDLVAVASQIDQLTEGVTGGSLIEGSESLDVRVRVGDSNRLSADMLAGLYILPPGLGPQTETEKFPGIPLSALGTFSLAPSDSAIHRRNGERMNTVQGFLNLETLPEEALAQFQASLAANPLALPAGYRIEWGGDSDARAETVRNLMTPLGLVVTMMVATIVLTFNSFRLSLIGFTVAGLSMGLSLLALAIFQYPFGIQALIGVIGSIGVSINAAIIIMTGLQADERARQTDPEAIRNVVLGSSRHIVSTTITTFGGFLPLILEGGGFWPPFAMAIAGGVLLSTVVSFYFVPPAFALAYGRRKMPKAHAELPNDAIPAPNTP